MCSSSGSFTPSLCSGAGHVDTEVSWVLYAVFVKLMPWFLSIKT